MNNRIKQLALEADEYCRDHVPNWTMDDYNLRLAKLVAQECIGIVEGVEPGYKDYRDQIEDAFRRDCVAEIKYKFGVEE